MKHSIVTFDALHTQKETTSIISRQKGDYVGGLKGNQSVLLEAARSVFTDSKREQIKKRGNDFYETSEKSHSQIETRRLYCTSTSCVKDEWTNLKNFICYEKYTCNVITGIENTECRFYISSLQDVELITQAIRGHWKVENNLHWHLNDSFFEDDLLCQYFSITISFN